MISYIFAIVAPLVMAFFGASQLYHALGEDSILLATKLAILLIVTSFLWNIYLITSLYF